MTFSIISTFMIIYLNSSLSALLEQLKESNPELMNIINQKNGVFEFDDSTNVDEGGETNSSTENYNGDGINTTNSEGTFIIYGSLNTFTYAIMKLEHFRLFCCFYHRF